MAKGRRAAKAKATKDVIAVVPSITIKKTAPNFTRNVTSVEKKGTLLSNARVSLEVFTTQLAKEKAKGKQRLPMPRAKAREAKVQMQRQHRR